MSYSDEDQCPYCGNSHPELEGDCSCTDSVFDDEDERAAREIEESTD